MAQDTPRKKTSERVPGDADGAAADKPGRALNFIEQIIQHGGAAVGKRPTMPANPDLNSKPAVVTALREYIRGLEGG